MYGDSYCPRKNHYPGMKILYCCIGLLFLVYSSTQSSDDFTDATESAVHYLNALPMISPQFPPRCGKNYLECLPREILIKILKATDKKTLYAFQCLSKYSEEEFAMPEFSSVYGKLGFKFSGAYLKVLVCPGNFDLNENALQIINHYLVHEITFTSIRTLMQSLDKINSRHRLIVHSAQYFHDLRSDIDIISKESIVDEGHASVKYSDHPQKKFGFFSKGLLFEELHVSLSHADDLELLYNLESVKVKSLKIVLDADLTSKPVKKMLSLLSQFKFASLYIAFDFRVLMEGWQRSDELLNLFECNKNILKRFNVEGNFRINTYFMYNVQPAATEFCQRIAPTVMEMVMLENYELCTQPSNRIPDCLACFEKFLSGFCQGIPISELDVFNVQNRFIDLILDESGELSSEAEAFLSKENIVHVNELFCKRNLNIPKYIAPKILRILSRSLIKGYELSQILKENQILSNSVTSFQWTIFEPDFDFGCFPNLQHLYLELDALDDRRTDAIVALLSRNYSLISFRLRVNQSNFHRKNQKRVCLAVCQSPRTLRVLRLEYGQWSTDFGDDPTAEIYWFSILKK